MMDFPPPAEAALDVRVHLLRLLALVLGEHPGAEQPALELTAGVVLQQRPRGHIRREPGVERLVHLLVRHQQVAGHLRDHRLVRGLLRRLGRGLVRRRRVEQGVGERLPDRAENLRRAEVVVPAVGHAGLQPGQLLRLELLVQRLLAGRLFLRLGGLGGRLAEPLFQLVV
jgi:hypothetical protein